MKTLCLSSLKFLCILLCFFGGLVGAATNVNETVKLTPRIRLQKQNYTAVFGKEVTISCEILTPNTNLVSWRFTNKEGYVTKIVISRPHWKYSGSTVHNPSLTIRNLAFSDEGTYRCMARNYAGTSISDDTAVLKVVEDLNECLSRPCRNGGTCIDGVATYTCRCSEKYDGDNCEIRKLVYPQTKSYCMSNPCLNNGICDEAFTNYICRCTDQYEGNNCEIRKLVIPTKQSLKLGNEECAVLLQTETNINKITKEFSKMLHITLEFRNTTALSKILENSNLYKPFKWARTSGKHGRGLLQLQPHFEILSLRSLTFHTDRIKIQMNEMPDGCIERINSTNYEDLVRYSLLKHLTRDDDEICNEHVFNDGGYSKFYYECCYINRKNRIVCYKVERNLWMKLIDVCTYIVIILLILYFPMVIPSTFYDKKYIPSIYELTLEHPMYLTAQKTKGTWQSNIMLSTTLVKNDQPFPMKKFERMNKCYPYLYNMDDKKEFVFRVDKVDLVVRNDQILSVGSTPFSLWRSFYDTFIECGIRKREENRDCCDANVCGCFTPLGKEYPWYKCLRSLMRLLLCVIICLPWIIRVYVFCVYEADTHEDRRHAAERKGLKTGLSATNITSALTPIHVLFILCYIVIVVDSFLMGNFSKKLKSLLQETMQACLQYNHDPLRRKILTKLIPILTIPLRKYGIFGLFIGIIFWIPALPFVILILSFRFFPTVGVVVCIIRFLLRGIRFRKEPRLYSGNDDEHRFYNGNDDTPKKSTVVARIILVLIVLLTILSFAVLVIECTIFLIDVAVYTVIGLIVNASGSVQCISIILIGFLYFNIFFGHISVLYFEYNKAVHKILQMENKGQLDKVAILRETDKASKAFKVKYASKETVSIKNDHGTPKWATKGVILFLSNFDKLYISKEFFFKVCGLHHRHCPGELFPHILKACKRFFIIVIFLLFLTFIVQAFGDAYSISVSSQLLVTVVIGMIPWILVKANIFFTRPKEPNLDELKDDYSFMNSFRELIENDEEIWKMDDIHVIENKLPNETNDITHLKMIS